MIIANITTSQLVLCPYTDCKKKHGWCRLKWCEHAKQSLMSSWAGCTQGPYTKSTRSSTITAQRLWLNPIQIQGWKMDGWWSMKMVRAASTGPNMHSGWLQIKMLVNIAASANNGNIQVWWWCCCYWSCSIIQLWLMDKKCMNSGRSNKKNANSGSPQKLQTM